MAEKVFLHIGLPKTGTTYLQTVLWDHRDQLREEGVLLPGAGKSDHWWSTLVVREDDRIQKRSPQAAGAWDRVVSETASWPGTAVISHEFFAAATEGQAAAAIARLAPADVHLVVTAREPVGLFAATWQESLKFGAPKPMADFGRSTPTDPAKVWSWRSMDLGAVLDRWAPHVPPGNVHVIPLSRSGGGSEDLWHTFSDLVGITGEYDLSVARRNASMGVVETELLRRLTPLLKDFTGFARHRWVRLHLAEKLLVEHGGERFAPDSEQIAACRVKGEEAVAAVDRHSVDVIGSVDDLRVPDELPERRTPADVSEGELAQVAVDTVAAMLADVRRLTRKVKALRENA